MFAKQLLAIKTLKGLVINSTHGVAVREHGVTIAVDISAEHGSFADTTLSQQQSASRNFGIFFLATEASQQRHELKARSVW